MQGHIPVTLVGKEFFFIIYEANFNDAACYFYRKCGVPTILLGNFEDNSSDNSEELQVFKQSAISNESNVEVNIHNLNSIKHQQSLSQIQNQEIRQNEEELLYNMVTELKLSDKKRNDIIPPPGAPKLENSARLRRYRHNVD